MAAALVERAWRDSTPESVEHDLAALWRELAAGGAVARAVMSNLVVFRFVERRSDGTGDAGRGPDGIPVHPDLESVVALHPSRTIVIEHDRGEHDARAPVGARVGVSIFGPPAGHYGVEQIVVKSACAEVSLPSIVRRFVRGDLPTSVWWTEDVSQWPPLPALVATGRQLVYDSRGWRDIDAGFGAIAGFARDGRLDLADLNWRRLSPLRRALLHAARNPGAGAAPTQIRIAHRPGDAALGWLLAGWLGARLEWPGGAWPPVEASRQGDELLELTIGTGDATFTAALNEQRVLVSQPGVPPMLVPAPRDSEAETVAAELRSLSHDPALHDALLALAARGVE